MSSLLVFLFGVIGSESYQKQSVKLLQNMVYNTTQHPLPPHSRTLSVYWAGIFKLFWSPGIDSRVSIPPAYVAWRVGTTTLFLPGS
jgi:hypothetical protein